MAPPGPRAHQKCSGKWCILAILVDFAGARRQGRGSARGSLHFCIFFAGDLLRGAPGGPQDAGICYILLIFVNFGRFRTILADPGHFGRSGPA